MQTASLNFNKSLSLSESLFMLIWIGYLLFGPIILTQDIPVHLNTAAILPELYFSPNSVFQDWFQWNQNVFTNIFTQWAFIIPSRIFTPENASRIVLLSMTLNLIYGFKELLKVFGVEKNSMFIYPFLLPVLFLKGFSNFYFSLGFLLFSLAFALNHLKGKPNNYVMLLSLLTLWAHPFTFMISIGIIIFLIIYFRDKIFTANIKQRVYLLFLMLPAGILFLLNKGNKIPLNLQGWDTDFLWELLKNAHYWTGYNEIEKWPVLLFICIAIGCLLINTLRKPERNSVFFTLLFILFILIYFKAPVGENENLYIYDRVQMLIVIFLSVALALNTWPEPVRKFLKYISIAVPVILLSIRHDNQKEIEKNYKQIQMLCAEISPQTVVLPLVHNHTGSYALHAGIFLHSVQLPLAGKQVVVLDNYSAHTGVFPMVWKPGKDPYLLLGEHWEGQPSQPDWKYIEELNIHYILELFPDESLLIPDGFDIEARNATGILYAKSKKIDR